ncbi:MAG: hypothetical protein AVDCRST_MAG87-2880, partial [uncultured Thermomicrobiales bacterium]
CRSGTTRTTRSSRSTGSSPSSSAWTARGHGRTQVAITGPFSMAGGQCLRG